MKAVALILFICFEMGFGNGSPPKIEISSLSDCSEEKVNPPNGVVLEAQIEGEGSSKSLNAKLELPFDIDDSLKYKLSAKKWENGDWKPITFKLSGVICEHVPKYLPGLWEKLSKIVNVPNKCPIKAGSYSVKGFKAEPSDINSPFMVPGKYLTTAIVFKDEAPIICKQAEITINQS